MTITNIELLAKLISTAQASYALLNSTFSLESDLKDKIFWADFTDKEAKEFVTHYELIHPQPNTNSGFSAALFKEKSTSEYVLAIRGTEDPFNKD